MSQNVWHDVNKGDNLCPHTSISDSYGVWVGTDFKVTVFEQHKENNDNNAIYLLGFAAKARGCFFISLTLTTLNLRQWFNVSWKACST